MTNVRVILYREGRLPELEEILTEVGLIRLQEEVMPPISQVQNAFASFESVTKFVPNNIIFPDAYTTEGITDVRVGEPSTAIKLEIDWATLWGITEPEVLMERTNMLLPFGTPGPIVILNVVASIRAQETADWPNVAAHVATGFCVVVMKLEPVTVIVLLMYPASGDALMRVGAPRTVTKLAAEIMLIPRG